MGHSGRKTVSSLYVQREILCKYCAEREGLRLGARSTNLECSICRGLLSHLTKTASMVIEKSKGYEFETFLIGASLPQSLLDAEDELRAKLKIKGKENLKTQITRIVTRKVSQATGKRVDYSRPDLTIILNPADNNVTFAPRSIWLKAAYRKLERGIAQRAAMCGVCNGVGCASCSYTGKKHASVQSVASSYFTQLFEAESCNFVWLGSEDENSLVLGTGRPFYVEIVGPTKRTFPRKNRTREKKQLISYSGQGVEILSAEILKSKPQQIPQFEVLAKVFLRRSESPNEAFKSTEIVADFQNLAVNVKLSRKYKTVRRWVHSVEAQLEDYGASLTINCEGGIPLKKLVTGLDGTVEPNFSSYVIGYEIDKERPFDILEVKAKSDSLKAPNLREQLIETYAADE
jgi:tRNA pseudouridine synthase 10